jgi:hypothetical protein
MKKWWLPIVLGLVLLGTVGWLVAQELPPEQQHIVKHWLQPRGVVTATITASPDPNRIGQQQIFVIYNSLDTWGRSVKPQQGDQPQ